MYTHTVADCEVLYPQASPKGHSACRFPGDWLENKVITTLASPIHHLLEYNSVFIAVPTRQPGIGITQAYPR